MNATIKKAEEDDYLTTAQKTSDGWFTFYRCEKCGKRLKLASDNTMVDKCHNCKRYICEWKE